MTSAPIKLSRDRFKAARKGEPYDPPNVHADRLLAILQPAAASDPAPDSAAFRKYVTDSFADRFLSLCAAHPVRARRP
jgi:hypothetical protein